VKHLTIQETAKLYKVAERWRGTPSENALEQALQNGIVQDGKSLSACTTIVW
jgi:hypothetical protein